MIIGKREMRIEKHRKTTIYSTGRIYPLEVEDYVFAFEDIFMRNRKPVLCSEHAALETRNMR